MAHINFMTREISCKLVYYGPGLSGKTTNLQVVHNKAPDSKKGALTSIATEGDRTLFFDYMPLNLGQVGGLTTKFQLYTVPGQRYYNATREVVLKGATGVVFVADSQAEKLEDNLDSFQNMEENLRKQGIDPAQVPLVIQYNKRDMPTALPVAELDAALNKYGSPTLEAVALNGRGVFPTLKKLIEIVLHQLHEEFGFGSRTRERGEPVASPTPAQRPASARVKAISFHPTQEGEVGIVRFPTREVKPMTRPARRPARRRGRLLLASVAGLAILAGGVAVGIVNSGVGLPGLVALLSAAI